MLKVLLFAAAVFAAPNHGAHVHGEGKVEIAFDALKGRIEMELPGDSIFGFEHQARSKKDKARKEAALKNLEDKIQEMIVFAVDSGCIIKKDIFEVNQAQNHSDIEAEFNVVCQKAVMGTNVSFHFQKIFARLKKVQVYIIADNVQKSLLVTKDGDSLELK